MPRRPRINLDGLPLHIVQRGHNREPCFFAEEDYFTYLHSLAEALKQEACELHAYALMTNHVHLLTPPYGQSSCVQEDDEQKYCQLFKLIASHNEIDIANPKI